MKIKFFFFALAASALIFNSSCKKDDSGDGGGIDATTLSPGKCKITFNVSGAASSSFSSLDLVSTAAKSDLLMNISGSALNGTSAELAMIILPANAAVGSYNAADDNPSFAFSYAKGETGWAVDPEKTFTLKVTAVADKTIEGTFSGTLYNDDLQTSVEISNGKFAAKFE